MWTKAPWLPLNSDKDIWVLNHRFMSGVTHYVALNLRDRLSPSTANMADEICYVQRQPYPLCCGAEMLNGWYTYRDYSRATDPGSPRFQAEDLENWVDYLKSPYKLNDAGQKVRWTATQGGVEQMTVTLIPDQGAVPNPIYEAVKRKGTVVSRWKNMNYTDHMINLILLNPQDGADTRDFQFQANPIGRG